MKRIGIFILVLVIGSIAGAVVAVGRDISAHAGRIYPRVTIGGIPVGGLTVSEAHALAQAAADRRLQRTLVVHLGADAGRFTWAELGLRAHVDEAVAQAYGAARTGSWWDRGQTRWALVRRGVEVPLRFTLDETALDRVVTTLAEAVATEAQDAAVTLRDGRVVMTQPSRTGASLDIGATVTRLRTALDGGATEVEAVLSTVTPKLTTEEAQELQAPLATFTTKMVNNPNRIHNIALAAGFLRGVILAPGDVLSYNKSVGPRTIERGFKEAPVLIDDELVAGDGGGVCQVSSTLFNVALLADFEILSRANHSRPVAYLPLGRDATVTYGGLDLIFRNTTGRHVLLWAEVRSTRLTITAFGTPTPGKAITILVTERTEIPPPSGTVTKKDPELEEGKVVTREAQPGYRVKTYRVVTVDGTVLRRELIGASRYRPVPRTIKIGIKKNKQVSQH